MSSLDATTLTQWRELSRRALEPNPYFDVDFLLSAHRWLRPDIDPQVAMVWSEGRLRAVLPFVERRSVGYLPVIVRSTAAPVGASVTDLHLPLLDGACARAALEVLLDELGRSRWGLPVLIDLVVHRLDGPVWELLEDVAATRGTRLTLREQNLRGGFRMPLGADPADRGAGAEPDGAVPGPDPDGASPDRVDATMLSHLSRSRRRSLARSLSALEKSFGPLTWADRTDDHQAIDDFAALEGAGWKGDAANGGQGVVAVDGGLGWFREVTEQLRRDGRLYVGELQADGHAVFMAVDMRSGQEWFGIRDVYDERFATFSPGALGRLTELAWFRTRTLTRFDSCVNPAVYPQVSGLYPEALPVGRVLVAGNTSARAGLLLAGLALQVRDQIRDRMRDRTARTSTASGEGGAA